MDRTQDFSNDGQGIASTPVERLPMDEAEDFKSVKLTNWILDQAGQRAVPSGNRQAGVQAAFRDDGRRTETVLNACLASRIG